jgi:integrase
MRRGELAGVAWPDVNLDIGTLRVERSLGVDSGDVFAKTPKSAAGERVIGLDPETTAILRSHRSRLVSDRLATGETYETNPLGLDLVFRAGPGGGLVRPDQISRYFTKEWSHAGLQTGVTLHSLRHSVASMLVGAGLSLVEVAAHMGHSVEVLQRTYARDLDPEARERKVVDVITAQIGS